MIARGVDDYVPRHQFLIDLLDFITDHQSLGDEVLLGIDANPSQGTDHQLEAFLQAANLVDLFQFRHGQQAPSTHSGGRTLDFLYGSTLLQQSLVACGVCRESDALDSDHRAVFADFDPSVLFDNKNDDPTQAARRNLRLKNKQSVLAYRELFTAKCDERIILTRVQSLNHLTSLPNYDRIEAISQYESLDADITWAMISSEKEVTTGSNGAHSFSPAFSDAGNAIRHWKRQIKLTASSSSLDHVLIPSQINGPLSADGYLQFCRTQLSQAWKEFRLIKAESKDCRQQYLNQCLADAIDETHRANTLRKIISAEAAAKLYQRLRFFLKGAGTSSIDHVLVPDEDDPSGYRRVSEKEALI
jgi:hypothetical protein